MGKKTHWEILIQNLSVHAYDKLHYGSITLYKTTADGKKRPLSGVEFHMTYQTDQGHYTAVPDENGGGSDGSPCTKGVCDYRGGNCRREKSVAGQHRGKPPMEMNLEDSQLKTDKREEDVVGDVKNGKYCFYDLEISA
ncbi:MAG: hypothetical protein ACLTDV_09290 [Eubacterium sp.]